MDWMLEATKIADREAARIEAMTDEQLFDDPMDSDEPTDEDE